MCRENENGNKSSLLRIVSITKLTDVVCAFSYLSLTQNIITIGSFMTSYLDSQEGLPSVLAFKMANH